MQQPQKNTFLVFCSIILKSGLYLINLYDIHVNEIDAYKLTAIDAVIIIAFMIKVALCV